MTPPPHAPPAAAPLTGSPKPSGRTATLPWGVLALAAALHLLPPLLFSLFLMPPPMAEARGDFGAYYYALRLALEGGNPYELEQLRQFSGLPLPPFFYPPPFLLTLVWSLALPMEAGYFAMFALNALLLLGALFLMRRSWGVDWKLAALVVATFFPLWDNLIWGQANLLLLLPALGAMVVAERRPQWAGALLGVAAVIKVVPALLLLYWVVMRNWRPLVAAAFAAVGLSVLTLPLVGLDVQFAYYAQKLLGLAAGDLKGLGLWVPITSEYNHSVVCILSHIWPGPDGFRPAGIAKLGSLAVTALLLLGWGRWVRRGCAPHAALAALLGIASIVTTYSWEHHLVLVLPAAVLAAHGGTSRWGFGVPYACMVFPLGLFMAVAPALNQHLVASVLPWISVGKLLGVVVLCELCMRAHSPARAQAVDALPAGA
ncbi:DUF2029 domain-containing protein [Pyxidicoccus fallax]|uniref:DUF2029 domain-containing protein n=1 Tax=Pyxidicoccus fallax TaxID=394095 RepID=A0A848LB59_9BACT|nr:glycosyltransferase family 87 protein [Pyxidicoccus fallax]NMO15726.1 DUF2029 domain-containing protein [Pyxidicoccus fallax]NPC79734.1 DUF2029 domain-containing protein [Pyxidicoccus fallax]